MDGRVERAALCRVEYIEVYLALDYLMLRALLTAYNSELVHMYIFAKLLPTKDSESERRNRLPVF